MWHLVLNGVATAERLPLLLGQKPCGCGQVAGPDRKHLFFSCDVLQPTLQSFAAEFQGAWASALPLQRHHLWLAIKPHQQLHQGIWDVVSVFAIYAFESGRRNWYDRTLKLARNAGMPNRSSRTGGSAHRPPMAQGAAMVESVGKVVLTEFWAELKAFIVIKTLPAEWLQVVPLNHPFVRPDSERRVWVVSQDVQ
jgi:hypothetical protein